MIPERYIALLQGSTSASAALLGLLFVAIQLAPARTIGDTAPVGRRSAAESTFTALVNVFFISLVGLTPGTNIGKVTAIMALIGLVGTLRLGGDYRRTRLTRQGPLRAATSSSLVSSSTRSNWYALCSSSARRPPLAHSTI